MTMNARQDFLVDTNVLIYVYDASSPEKRRRAMEVMDRLFDSGRGSLSVQVLGEFYTNVTRKPLLPLTRNQAHDSSIRLTRSWPIWGLTERIFVNAIQGVAAHSLSYWDALLWATAGENGVSNILTEDQQHSRIVGGIRYLNPFADDFDLALLD
jgi:predicted nucleic acid-binding protein